MAAYYKFESRQVYPVGMRIRCNSRGAGTCSLIRNDLFAGTTLARRTLAST